MPCICKTRHQIIFVVVVTVWMVSLISRFSSTSTIPISTMWWSFMVVSTMISIVTIPFSVTSSSTATMRTTIMTSSMAFAIFHIHTWYDVGLFFPFFLFLTFFVVDEIIKDGCCVRIAMKGLKNLLSLFRGNFLSVSAISNRFVLI